MLIDDLVLKALMEDPSATDEDLAIKVFQLRNSRGKSVGTIQKRAKEVHAAIMRLTRIPTVGTS